MIVTGQCNSSFPYDFGIEVDDPNHTDSQLAITSLFKADSGPASATYSLGSLYIQFNFGSSIGTTSFSITIEDPDGASDTETFILDTSDGCTGGPPGDSDVLPGGMDP